MAYLLGPGFLIYFYVIVSQVGGGGVTALLIVCLLVCDKSRNDIVSFWF